MRIMNDAIPMISHGLDFFSVLQELVDLVLRDLQEGHVSGMDAGGQLTSLEVGCGSGAISLSLLKSLPQVRFVFIALRMISAVLMILPSGICASSRKL